MVKAKKKTILLVEDDPFLYKVLKQRLEKDTIHKIIVATDGEAAVREAIANKPDLMLLDLILPKKNGFEVLAEIRKIPELKNMPVVVLSNLGQQEDIDQVKKLGVIDYMVKADHSLSQMVKKIEEFAANV